ncbi:MAG: histidinol-phosphatase [Bacteroidales bacterium]|nr:histidinol-phosphatase [Bacteroidales bacterium]
MLTNLHTHTCFSDGSDEPLKYVQAALDQGMTSLGFSDHSPLPFENKFALRENQVNNYCNTILSLKNQFSPHSELICDLHSPNYDLSSIQHPAFCINIFLGLEADFIPGASLSFSYLRETYPLDFLIGSVHLVRNGDPLDLWFIDGPNPATYDEGLNKLFGGDIRKGVTAYYRQINEMLTTGKMDILGHLDKIKMHNRGRLFSEEEPWYLALVDETLDLVKKSGVIIEVNTRGIYKQRSNTTFPGPVILKRIHRLDIPVILSSDAHSPEELTRQFSETKSMLSEIGFSEIMKITSKGWVGSPLNT